jgi:DNA-binding LytR/AlgR family response regulator
MTPLKIGIVEDDLIIAQSIGELLQQSGYDVTRPAKRYSEAISMIEEERPDLLLLDVKILGAMDGVEVGRTVRKAFNIPFIFLTANTDFETISRAKEVMPAAFLAKPITKAQLYAAIEIAMANTSFSGKASSGDDNAQQIENSPALFVKDGYSYRKVDEDEIIYAESELNYVIIHLVGGKSATVRTTITDFESSLSPERCMRVHRGYIVRCNKVASLEGNALVVGGYSIPIGKSYREQVLRRLNIRR